MDLRTGKSKANVKIPVSPADFGMNNSSEEKLIDVEDKEQDEHVKIFIE